MKPEIHENSNIEWPKINKEDGRKNRWQLVGIKEWEAKGYKVFRMDQRGMFNGECSSFLQLKPLKQNLNQWGAFSIGCTSFDFE
jgi:hypothetical protein